MPYPTPARFHVFLHIFQLLFHEHVAWLISTDIKPTALFTINTPHLHLKQGTVGNHDVQRDCFKTIQKLQFAYMAVNRLHAAVYFDDVSDWAATHGAGRI